MKKIIIILLVIIAPVSLLFAQEFKAGAIVGFAPSQVDGDGMSGYYKIGFTGGLFVYRDVSKFSRLQGELLFTMKGSKTSPKDSIADRHQISANYVDLNLLYIFKCNDWLHIRGGITPGFLLYKNVFTPTGIEVDEGVDFRKFTIGATLGVSYFFNDRLSLSGNYNYSIVSFREGEVEIYNLGLYEKNAQHHSYATFTLSYRF